MPQLPSGSVLCGSESAVHVLNAGYNKFIRNTYTHRSVLPEQTLYRYNRLNFSLRLPCTPHSGRSLDFRGVLAFGSSVLKPTDTRNIKLMLAPNRLCLKPSAYFMSILECVRPVGNTSIKRWDWMVRYLRANHDVCNSVNNHGTGLSIPNSESDLHFA